MAAATLAIAAGSLPGEALRRRDFINIAAVSACGVGGLATLYPLVSQMAPSADVVASGSIEVDLATIAEGQAIKASLGQFPVFVRHLTPGEVTELRRVHTDDLRDPQALDERTKSGSEQWVVTLGVCTHLSCVPLGAAQGEPRGEYHGYFCPCHGSQFDAAGRIRKGPAPRNLEIPEYRFTSATTITIGSA